MIGLIRLLTTVAIATRIHRAFNLSVVINLKTKSDDGLPDDIQDKIQSAVSILVNRHGALRVTFCSHPTDNMIPLSFSQASSHSCVNSGGTQVAQKLNHPSELDICTFKSDRELIQCSCDHDQHEHFVGAGCVSCTLHEEIFKPFDMSKQLFRCVVFTPFKGKINICLVFHHLITDGMSLFVLSNEFLALLREDSSHSLQTSITNFEASPRLSNLQFAQAQVVDPKAKKRSIEKWVSLLSNIDSCTNLSSNQYGRKVVNSVHVHSAENLFLELSDKSSRSITHFSQVYRVSPAVVIATVYSLALHFFTGERDIIIGMVSANRSRAMENVVGYFANTLPLRIDLNHPHASDLQSLMKNVRKNWSMILAGGIDLVDLVPLVPCLQQKSSSRESTTHSSPLQVLFSFYDVGEGRSLPNKLTISGVAVNCEVNVPKPGHTHADLWMEANPNYVNENGKQVFHWEYRQSILTQSMVEYLHTILCQYLEAAVDAITQGKPPINPLELRIQTTGLSLSQVDGGKVFKKKKIEMQDTSHLCYIQRFERKCKECPHSPAFRLDNDSIYTYSDVHNMISAIALFLIKKHNIKPGDRVALLLPRDPHLYLVVLAILKCGAAYVPVIADAAQPVTEGRLLKIFKIANTRFLLTVKSLWNSIPSKITDSIVYLDELLANLPHHKDSTSLSETDFTLLDDLELTYSPDLLFYILFTSGTTGEPKAVGITNANLNATFNNFLQLLLPEETKLTLAATGINFDSHVLDSLAPLLNGACLVVAKSALDLADALQEYHDFNDSGVSLNTSSSSSSSSYFDGITFTFATPSTASVVDFPSSMRAIMIGGEVFTKACYQKTKHIPRVLNIYGPTECSVFMTAIEVPKISLASSNSLTSEEISQIGWPLPDVNVMIMNEAKNVVPIGRVGELHIAGPIVSSTGYLNATKKSKQCFFPNPANQEQMVYATGDLMYMLPNHMLQFVGRKDSQIKLRGIRIHLQEVTNALSSHPDVQYATSLVINPSTPSAILVSFVTPKKIDKSSLLEHLRCRLPSHMVPSVIITDDELIRYKLSKDYVQSRALKAVEEASHEQDNSSKDPVVLNMASKIAVLFGKVLGAMEYPINGDFFAFGGHSLLCFQLLKEVNQEIRVRLSLTHIMQNPTPLALANVVNGLKDQDESLVSLCMPHSNLQTSVSTSNIHYQPQSHQKHPCNAKNENPTQIPVSAANKFDYLEPVPDFPLSADLEAKLTQIFKENKNCSIPSPEDVEFQIISVTLARETGLYIPSDSLVYYKSMETLQAHLKLKTVLSFTSHSQQVAVTLRPPTSNEDKPIFFIHSGVIGWSLSYAKLAKRLGTYCVAIQRTPEAPVSSFEEMAAFYLRKLQSVQPEGPYKLVGVCYGAYLVYELMRQLTEKGERVELAVLINNSPVNEKRPTVFNEQGLPLPNTMAHPFYFYESTLRLNLREDIKLIEKHNNINVDLNKLTTNLLLEAYPWLPFSTSELAKAYGEFIKTLKPAWFDYTPKSVKQMELVGNVVLIRNKEHPFFRSHNYGLLGLLNSSRSLHVIVSPRQLGLLNEETTIKFISDSIREYLGDN